MVFWVVQMVELDVNIGMVQANVEQKLVKCNILRVFSWPILCWWCYFLSKPMLFWNLLFNQLCASLTLTAKYSVILLNTLVLYGVLTSSKPLFQQVDDEKTKKCIIDRLQLLATILTQLLCLVASIKALVLLYWAMCTVLYCCTAMAIEMAHKYGKFMSTFCSCNPVGRWGNTEQILAQ